MYEHRLQPPLSRTAFLRRLSLHGGYAAVLVGGSAAIGTLGYHALAGYRWIDAFLNACMLLGGMGPVGDLPNDGSKLFAAIFALYAGLVFLIVTALLLTPIFHRVLHRFHWEIRQRGAE